MKHLITLFAILIAFSLNAQTTLIDNITDFVDDLDNTKKMQLQLSSLSPGTTRILTVPDANTTLVGTDAIQTLINKTIDAGQNSITNIGNGEIKFGAGIDASKIGNGTVSNTKFQRLSNIGSSVVGVTDVQTLTNKTFTDNSTFIQDNADNTRKLQLELSGITTGNTRTLSVPDVNTTIVGTDATQTLTNKTINSATNTITISASDITSGTFQDARIAQSSVTQHEGAITIGNLSGAPIGSVVGTNDAQTLTNKTLTTPIISTISNVGILTLPTSTTTLVGRETTDNFVNKTIDADQNTITNIGNGEIKFGAGIDASKIGNGTVSNTEFQRLNSIGSSVVGESDTQTLTNKTFTDNSTFIQDNVDNTKKVQLELSGITTGTTRTLTVPDVNTTIVGTDATQTLTNKFIDGFSNTITISTSDITSGTFQDARIAQSSVTQHEGAITIGNLSGAPIGSVVGTNDPQTLTNKTFTDNSTFIQDNGDNTKKVQLELSGITTSTTRVLTVPNVNTTIVGTNATQTLTNKTINSANNTITISASDITSGTFQDARIAQSSVTQHEGAITIGNLSGAPIGSVVGTNDAQTLTNKTLTTPIISTISNVGILTLPTSTTTLVGRTTLDILTNKTIDADANTITNIDDADIKVGAGIDASKIGDGTVSNTKFQRLSSIGSSVVGVTDLQTLANKTLTDNSTFIQDNVDNTKKVQLQLSGITTGNTRTLTVPDVNTTIVGTNATQTLTNKTINSASNIITITASDIASGILSDARIGVTSITQHESSITHQNLLGAGTNSHAQIDAHVADATKHRSINDAGTSATELWSANKIISELATKSLSFNATSLTGIESPTNTASGQYSTSIGFNTTAKDYATLAIGQYNTDDTTPNPTTFSLANRAFIIGNGADSANKSDAMTVLFDGTTTIAGDLTVNSDARLKSNITSLGSTLASLLVLDGKRYTLKNDESQQKIGLLAQDVQDVFPELVRAASDDQGTLSVNYQGLIPVLINAIKEQQAFINDQQTAFKKQQASIEEQQKEINELKEQVKKLLKE